MATQTQPRIDLWQATLFEACAAKGHAVDARRSRRNGATYWRIDGSRWLTAFVATRRMEVLVHGKEYP